MVVPGLRLGFTACCLCPLQLTVVTARGGHPLGWLALCAGTGRPSVPAVSLSPLQDLDWR